MGFGCGFGVGVLKEEIRKEKKKMIRGNMRKEKKS